MRWINWLRLGVLLAVTAAGQASAAPFILMSFNRDLVTFADQGSVRREPSRVTVWTYTVTRKDLADGSGLMAAKTEVDCLGDRFRDVYAVSYGWDGRAVTTKDAVQDWDVVIPDTYGVRVLDLVCRGEAQDVLGREGTFLDVARAVRKGLEKVAIGAIP